MCIAEELAGCQGRFPQLAHPCGLNAGPFTSLCVGTLCGQDRPELAEICIQTSDSYTCLRHATLHARSVSRACVRVGIAHLENTVPCGTGLPEKPCGQALPVRSIPGRVLPVSRKLSSMDRAPLAGSKLMTNSRLLFV